MEIGNLIKFMEKELFLVIVLKKKGNLALIYQIFKIIFTWEANSLAKY